MEIILKTSGDQAKKLKEFLHLDCEHDENDLNTKVFFFLLAKKPGEEEEIEIRFDV